MWASAARMILRCCCMLVCTEPAGRLIKKQESHSVAKTIVFTLWLALRWRALQQSGSVTEAGSFPTQASSKRQNHG